MVALLIGLPCSSFSQILDDSTVLVYGPSTLNVILEENLKSNNKRLVFIDTLVGNLDRFTTYGRSDYNLRGHQWHWASHKTQETTPYLYFPNFAVYNLTSHKR